MAFYLPYLIPIGLALFVLRSQLLRISIHETAEANGNFENIHKSPVLGASSGWVSLIGALALIGCAIYLDGWLRGAATIVIGLGLGVVGSAVFLPMVANTLAMGHHGGEGNRSIAELNRKFGHIIAFAVGWIAFMCLYLIFDIKI
jgi:hypothetical protein